MSRAVKLSKRTALTLFDLEPDSEAINPEQVRAFQELRVALNPPKRPKSSAVRKTEKKRRAKAFDTKLIRGAVMARAGGRCESPNCRVVFSDFNPGELDHFWGRAKAPQTLQNCWALCGACHRAKTNAPNPLYWLTWFRTHAALRGYDAEAEKANAKIEAEELLRASESVGTP